MLLQHSAIYVAARLLVGLIAMGTTAVLTRLLPPSAYGRYGLALVVMTFGTTIFFDWINASFARLYQSRRNDPRTISTFVQIYFLLAAGTVLVTALAWALGVFHGDSAAVYGVGVTLIWAYAWFELVASFEVADFQPGVYLLMCLGRSFFVLVAACGAAWLTDDPLWTAEGYGIGMLAASFLGRSRRWSLHPRGFDRALAIEICRYGLPIAACFVLSGLATTGTRWLVDSLDGTEALGYYTAAYILAQNSLGVIAYGLTAAGYQLAVRAVESHDSIAANRQLTANVSVLFAILAPASLGMALTANGLAHTLVGANYAVEVSRLTPWLAATQFFNSIRTCYLDHAFQLGKKSQNLIWVLVVAAVVSIALTLYLVPRMGPTGAGVGMTIAMVASCVVSWLLGRRAYTLPLPWQVFARVSVALAVMSLVVVPLNVFGHGVLVFALQVVLGGLAFSVAALALNVLELRAPVLDRLRGVAVAR